MTAFDQLRVYQVCALYGVTTAEVNAAIESGALRARDRSRNPEARRAYRIIRADAEAWVAAGCPAEPR